MIELKPCPFCGQEPEQRNSKCNPYARCATPDCAGGKLPLISLDVPEDIERWNRRGREQALERAIRRQANAARRGMNAAKEHGAHMEAKAERLHAECNPKALDSERAANAQLTEELERVEAERDTLAAHVERLTSVADKLSTVAPEYLDHLAADAHLVLRDAPTTSLARLKAQCWKEAYLAGMEAGHHWTVEGGYVAGGDEEAAEDYVADRQAEGEP